MTRTFLFLLSAYPDVDHMAPLIWTCLERGDRALAVFDVPYPHDSDYRIRFLRRYPNFAIHDLWGVASARRAARVISRLVWTPSRLEAFLRRRGVAACFVDWGTGLGPDAPAAGARRLSHALRDARARRSERGAWRRVAARSLTPLRTALILAAHRTGIPTFCVPHGVRTILNADYSQGKEEALRRFGGVFPDERQGFTAHVFTAEFHRQLGIRYYGLVPDVAQTWGSLRYSPSWMAIVHQICPKPSWPPGLNTQPRVLFLLPRWDERVDRLGTLALLTGLAERDDIGLAVKAHPRTTGDRDLAALRRWPHVWWATDAHTPALVADSVATIGLASGAVMDAIMQAKPLLYPTFLHENRLVFDEHGGCLIARTPADVHRFLDDILRDAPSPVTEAEVQRVLRIVLYGDREPYDVPAYYYARIQENLESPRGVGGPAGRVDIRDGRSDG